ncbi:hypothetical protein PYCCODRAFT_1368405, partial [Trametes coccinea BRFM310]
PPNPSAEPIPPETVTLSAPVVEEHNFEPERSENQGESRWSTCIRKESTYVQRLKAGKGTATGRVGRPVLLRGVQEGTASIEEVPESKEMETVLVVQEVREEAELAMAVAMGDTECIEPSYAKAKKCPDWLKWQEAVQAELDSLVANNTWRVIPVLSLAMSSTRSGFFASKRTLLVRSTITKLD